MTYDLDFDELHAFVTKQPLHWLHERLVALGSWPYERLPIQVLSPIDGAERLKNREHAALVLIKALLPVLAHDGELYLVRTADVAWGVRRVHHVDLDDEMREAVKDTYGKVLEA